MIVAFYINTDLYIFMPTIDYTIANIKSTIHIDANLTWKMS